MLPLAILSYFHIFGFRYDDESSKLSGTVHVIFLDEGQFYDLNGNNFGCTIHHNEVLLET